MSLSPVDRQVIVVFQFYTVICVYFLSFSVLCCLTFVEGRVSLLPTNLTASFSLPIMLVHVQLPLNPIGNCVESMSKCLENACSF